MRSLRLILFSGVVLLLIVGACAPQPSTPTVQSSPQSATPSLVPINLAGPEMKVGSTWLYADGSLLVPVPAGIFTMGHGGPDDPQHQVNLPDFWIYRTKVTNGQYAYCVATGQCTPPVPKDDPTFGDPLHANDPVVGVDYGQAAAYCGFVHARLPTEAEWEKTARGPDANIYPWGNGAPSCDLLNYETCQGKTTPVNAYPQGQSYYHAFDMEGNAFEWVADWYQQDYYLSAPPDNPPGPARGFARVVRSSAFNSGTNQTQAYNRFHSGPADHRDNLGFRCVVDDPTYFASYCQYPATYGTDGVGGGSSGLQSTVTCPDLSIDQSPGCNGTNPLTVVMMKASGLWQPAAMSSPQSCSSSLKGYILPPGNPGVMGACNGDGQLSICSFCKVTLKGQPQCPAGYVFVNDSRYVGCLGPARPGQCLPGFHLAPPPATYTGYAPVGYPAAPTQSAGQCCELDSGGTLGPRASPSCPAGTYFDGQECISTQVQGPYCKKAGIDLKSCQGGGGGGCKITEQSCASSCAPLGYIYNAANCSCNCNAG